MSQNAYSIAFLVRDFNSLSDKPSVLITSYSPAIEALKKGGTYPAVLNVANEQAVYRFLNSEITFTDIPIIIEQACDKHDYILHPTLEELLFLENWTVDFVKSFKTKD